MVHIDRDGKASVAGVDALRSGEELVACEVINHQPEDIGAVDFHGRSLRSGLSMPGPGGNLRTGRARVDAIAQPRGGVTMTIFICASTVLVTICSRVA